MRPYIHTLLLLIYVLLACCNASEITENKTLQIVVKYEQSYEVDLSRGIYIVYYFNKSPTTIKFRLKKNEYDNLQKVFYDLMLHKLPDSLDLVDDCHVMPKLFTYIDVQTELRHQKFKINEECSRFHILDQGKANRILKFIKHFRELIEQIPEIRTAPKSDIHYI